MYWWMLLQRWIITHLCESPHSPSLIKLPFPSKPHLHLDSGLRCYIAAVYIMIANSASSGTKWLWYPIVLRLTKGKGRLVNYLWQFLDVTIATINRNDRFYD